MGSDSTDNTSTLIESDDNSNDNVNYDVYRKTTLNKVFNII